MLKNLQVLRAFAALWVVIHHYNFLNFNPGAFGVDIFFVISGFIIAYTTQKSNHFFLRKRFIRIAPMYYGVTMLVIVCWIFRPQLFNNTNVDIIGFIKTFLFIPYSNGPVFGLGYTLNYEMAFYLVTAVFLKLIKNAQMAFFSTAIFMVGYYLAIAFFRPENYILEFYGSNIILEFVYGIILYFIYEKVSKREIPGVLLNVLLAAALLSMLFFFYIVYPEIPLKTRGFTFGLPALIICSFAVFSDGYYRKSSIVYRYFLQVGNASYILYLIHPFVIFGVVRLINPLFNSQNIFLLLIEFIISITAVCILSSVIYKRIEIPLQKILKSKLLR